MSDTTRIPLDELAGYLDTFTKRFLRDGSPEAVDVEIAAADWGDQIATQGARLLGITYEPGTHTIEFELDSGDHRVVDPQEVWAVEESDGFVSALQVMRPDGSRDIATVRRVGMQRRSD